MSYVMVPVPEDRVQDVMQFVVRLVNQDALEEWDEESIAQMFEDVDEPSRALLSTVAQAVQEGDSRPVEDAAAIVELSPRELMGILREVNEMAMERSRPALLAQRMVSETLPNGRKRNVRVLSMTEELAPLVAAADRAHLLAEGDPLGPELDR